ncbi:hypothetical protein AB4Y72_14645 [Arthrobacter sp. YAF34]|uniref:hypothetical protein n=1 Tax=Arthrobacter sp. YAF34 TaxID=3233083 RepID=UPI003F905F15
MSPDPRNADSPKTGPLNMDPVEQDPSAKDPAADEKVQLQLAIFEVTPDARGKSLGEIRQMLLAAFSRRGVEPPPDTWLDSVASAASYGEPYIIDLPAALAADGEVPAPNEEVRRGLASRRRLRQQRLPAGIFPSPAEWEVTDKEVAGGAPSQAVRGHPRALTWRIGGAGTALAGAALLIAAAVLAVRAVSAVRRHRAGAPSRRRG